MSSEKIDQSIAAIFRATRKFNRLQQVEFAAILEVTQGTISKIESGTMHPELILWFRFLRFFKIANASCFTQGGVEFNSDAFQVIKENGASLLPQFSFANEKIIFSVRTIRPIFNILVKSHSKAFNAFLKKNQIDIGVFYILNHPLTFDFADAFFSFLQERKINEKSMTLLDLSFNSDYSEQLGCSPKSKSFELFFSELSNEKDVFVKYKLNASSKAYTVSLSKEHLSSMHSLANKGFILNYNLLYPYYFLKSTKACETTKALITEIIKESVWEISYGS